MTEEQGQASRLGHHIFRAARLGALARKEPERAAVLGLPVRVHVDHDREASTIFRRVVNVLLEASALSGVHGEHGVAPAVEVLQLGQLVGEVLQHQLLDGADQDLHAAEAGRHQRIVAQAGDAGLERLLAGDRVADGLVARLHHHGVSPRGRRVGLGVVAGILDAGHMRVAAAHPEHLVAADFGHSDLCAKTCLGAHPDLGGRVVRLQLRQLRQHFLHPRVGAEVRDDRAAVLLQLRRHAAQHLPRAVPQAPSSHLLLGLGGPQDHAAHVSAVHEVVGVDDGERGVVGVGVA
eukprot:scaffold69_cov248-Pinguiococcus_pyrenoidosus.AAC.73